MQKAKAFTLVELMLVVIIVGILASMVMPKLTGRAERARRAAAKADLEANIPSALDLYEMDHGQYPQSLESLTETDESGGPYLKKIPKDPWNNTYHYQRLDAVSYKLSSLGRDGIEGNDDDIITE